MQDDFFFAWEGADHPDGPWHHLRVLEVEGHEGMSELYEFHVDVVARADASPDVRDLVGANASLRIQTQTVPQFRLIHGIIANAEELGAVSDGTRYRFTLAPHVLRATMMKKCAIHLEKTVLQIVEDTLRRNQWGAALVPSEVTDVDDDDGDPTVYRAPRPTYALRCIEQVRVADQESRPYCVQYDETDFDFVCRLLEEEGISYHFEHTKSETILVLSDFDGGRRNLGDDRPLSRDLLERRMAEWRLGARMRPKSVSLSAHNWKKPTLDLAAFAPKVPSEFHTHEFTLRYEHSKESGEELANRRLQRLDTERQWAAGLGHCRLLGAGCIFRLEHENPRFAGTFLVTQIRHRVASRGSFGADSEQVYTHQVEAIRCGTAEQVGPSHFRPACSTSRPRVLGSQTAVVTADPSSAGAEIHVGGPEDVGCVRLRFRWDNDADRLAREPSSAWVRVSQMFAGANHGAMWHPRVGDEVVVEFLDGDPDQPLVTGRVYNGLRKPHVNPTQKPTFSAIKSLTSPHNGNFNMLSFEDEQGAEEINIHAARDYHTNVKRDCSRGVGQHENVKVVGDQTIEIGGDRSLKVDGSHTITVGESESVDVGISQTTNAKITIAEQAGTSITETAPLIAEKASSMVHTSAPTVIVNADGVLIHHAGAQASTNSAVVKLTGTTSIGAEAPLVHLKGQPLVVIEGGIINVKGQVVNVTGPSVNVNGGTVNIKGDNVDINC